VPELDAIVAAAHAAGARISIDAVAAAPHRALSLAALGADTLACSAYKWYGPHIGILCAAPALLEELVPDKLAPSPDEAPDRVDVRDPRQLDDDAVVTLDDDDGLGDAGRVHAPLDDVLDHAERLTRRLDAILGKCLVLDPQSALEVETELRLDRPPRAIGRGRIGDPKIREEDDDQGQDADDGDEDGARSAHTGGMLHESPLRRGRDGSTSHPGPGAETSVHRP